MALAQIQEIKANKLVQRSARLGRQLLSALQSLEPEPISRRSNGNGSDEGRTEPQLRARGLGLLAGIECCFANGKAATTLALAIVKAMLHHGFVMLPEGEHSNVVGLTPPLTITETQLNQTVEALAKVLAKLEKPGGLQGWA
jgi:4-aminobutyrate aminotransferase-like enzyme